MISMRLPRAIHDWIEERKERKRLASERLQAGRRQSVGMYEETVRWVLEQFIRSDFSGSMIQKTDPGEWELRHTSETGELITDLKIQLDFDREQPKAFIVIYYRRNGMHMRQAPLGREALARTVRKCISS
jgi:hypothetical protein